MKHILCFAVFILLTVFLFASKGFEGTFVVQYTSEKQVAYTMNVKVKDSLVYLKQTQGGLAKYDYYLLNLNSRDFFTVSKSDKKVVIKYDLDKLLELYNEGRIKEGFSIQSLLTFKPTDKVREEEGIKMTRYVGEDEIYKSSFWLGDIGFNFNQLIPLLRLLNNWNEAQASEGIIFNAEVSNKVSKRESTVKVTMKKEPVPKEAVTLPKNYLQKDFARLLESEKNSKDLKLIVKTFAGF